MLWQLQILFAFVVEGSCLFRYVLHDSSSNGIAAKEILSVYSPS